MISFIDRSRGLNAGTTSAQEAEAPSSRLSIEEIVVTGTKRDIGQQDAAVAVSALTEQSFRNTFANDVPSLGTLVPNLTLTTQPGFNAVSGGIRGTGSVSILVTEDPSVGFLIDDFGINPKSMDAILESYLYRYRPYGQYTSIHESAGDN